MAAARTVDVAIVGNGVLGLSVAVEVARRAPDVRVAVVGPPGREGSATAAAGAMHNCFGEVTQYTAGHPAAQAKFAIAREALQEWPVWRDMLADAAGPGPGTALRDSFTHGTFVLLSNESGQITDDNFAAMHAALAEYGEEHEEVDPHSIDGLSPHMGARPLRALYLHREGAVDARCTLDALEAAARSHNVRFEPTTVRALLADADSVRGVRLAGGNILSAATVVLAAGSMSGDLARGVLPPGAVPPLLHGTGLALLTRRTVSTGARHVIRTPNRAASCGLHLVPVPGAGRQYIGATSVITTRPPHGPELGVAQDLMRAVCEQVDQGITSSQVERWLCGRRPIPLDSFPLIGPSSLQGLFFATGTYRDGFHCSPVIARHVADHLLGTTSPDERFAWFLPERLPIQTMTVEEAVAETVAHGVDALYEHGLRMPSLLGDEPAITYMRQRVRRGYERLQHPVALPPEVVLSEFVLPGRDAADPTQDTWLEDYLQAAHIHHA